MMDWKVPQNIADERMEICKKCDNFNILKICNQCGCLLTLKTNIKDTECPIGRWKKYLILN